MTHDFAKKNKPKPKANSRKKKSTPNKPAVSHWVWLFTGIVIGVFVSFLGFLSDVTPDASETKVVSNKTAEKKKADNNEGSETRFDFYTLLPEREMIVPTEREPESHSNEPALVYILQAGSFKTANDADRLRAQLTLMGFEPKVEAVRSKNGDLWHRVQIGPFSSRSKLAKARGTLISKGIDTLLLKRKAEG